MIGLHLYRRVSVGRAVAMRITEKKPGPQGKKGVPNRFRPGESVDRPAKSAGNKVMVRALKLLKDMG